MHSRLDSSLVLKNDSADDIRLMQLRIISIVILSERGTRESNAERDAVHRDLGFSNSFKFSRGRENSFSCVARKKQLYRI